MYGVDTTQGRDMTVLQRYSNVEPTSLQFHDDGGQKVHLLPAAEVVPDSIMTIVVTMTKPCFFEAFKKGKMHA